MLDDVMGYNCYPTWRGHTVRFATTVAGAAAGTSLVDEGNLTGDSRDAIPFALAGAVTANAALLAVAFFPLHITGMAVGAGAMLAYKERQRRRSEKS